MKKRDGRIEPYDEARIARAVIRAGRHAGSAEQVEHLAREMARSVTLFLARRQDRAPETAQIGQSLAEALEETGHGQIARAVRDWRAWRQKRGAEVRVRDRSEAAVEVLSRRAARPWSKQRIVRTLEREAGLGRDAAEEVARAVEERVFAAGLNQISSNLLRELIDADLFERGYSAQLGRLEVLGVPKPDLERLAFLGQGRTPLALEDRVARTALERFALDELVEGKGAVAHRRGDVHFVGLGRPLRMTSGGLCAVAAADRPEPAQSVLEAVRRWVRVVRAAAGSYNAMLGLVGPERVLARFTDDGPLLREALELLLDAVIAPCPDDLPPAPELVLVADSPAPSPDERRALAILVELLARRGSDAAGVRLLVRLEEAADADEQTVTALVAAARTGAHVDVLLGPGPALASRGMLAGVGAPQAALINAAGVALAAGRGQRERLTRGLRAALEATLEAFHHWQRRVFAAAARPASSLFAPEAPERRAAGAAHEPERRVDTIGLVGLDAAMRYLTGEGLAENARVAELALEVRLGLAEHLARVAPRFGLEAVALEDVPSGDAAIRLAALDVERFAEARELLGDAAGWDAGVRLGGDPAEVQADVRARLWLARRLQAPLLVPRPILAVLDAPSLQDALERSAKGTARAGAKA